MSGAHTKTGNNSGGSPLGSLLPWIPPQNDYSRVTGSPRRGYAAIREEREEEEEEISRTTTSASGGSSSRVFSIPSSETSPLILVHKKATKEVEKQYTLVVKTP